MPLEHAYWGTEAGSRRLAQSMEVLKDAFKRTVELEKLLLQL